MSDPTLRQEVLCDPGPDGMDDVHIVGCQGPEITFLKGWEFATNNEN